MIERIYHHYETWEDYKCGMYDELKEGRVNRVELAQTLLSEPTLCERWMREVVKRWKIACEQIFSNVSMNRKAWLGQAACCLWAGVKEDETREAWKKLTEEQRNTANGIAETIITDWENERLTPNKNQSCFFDFFEGLEPEHEQVKKIKEYVEKWKNQGYPDGIPDEADYFMEKKRDVPSYRKICKCILSNDFHCKSLGFAQKKCEAYHLIKRINLGL